MKAPDKIYMPNELLSEEWQRHIENEDTCYIRKDALIEWAKDMKEANDGVCDISYYQEFIDKLESM